MLHQKKLSGRIMLERVSKTQNNQKLTARTNFSDDIFTCNKINVGDWKQLIDDKLDLTSNDIKEIILNTYSLEVLIADGL